MKTPLLRSFVALCAFAALCTLEGCGGPFYIHAPSPAMSAQWENARQQRSQQWQQQSDDNFNQFMRQSQQPRTNIWVGF